MEWVVTLHGLWITKKDSGRSYYGAGAYRLLLRTDFIMYGHCVTEYA